MDDMMSKLQEILGSEQGRQKLKALAGMFGAGQDEESALPEPAAAESNASSDKLGDLLDDFLAQHQSSQPEDDSSSVEAGASIPGLGGPDIGMLMKLAPVISKLNTKKDDKNTRLILAIKPHLKPERQQKADEAVRMMQLLDLLPMIKELNLFDGLLKF